MKMYRLATIFLIAIMAAGLLTVATPLTSAHPWTYPKGPPIVIEDAGVSGFAPVVRALSGVMPNGSIAEWEPILALNNDPLGDTEAWSTDGTTYNMSLYGTGLWEGDAPHAAIYDMARDLKALYMWFDPSSNINIRLDLAHLFPGFGYGPGLANASMYTIFFSTNLSYPGFSVDPNWPLMVLTDPPGRTVGNLDGLWMGGECAWEYCLAFSETFAVIVGNQKVANNSLYDVDYDTWMGYNSTVAGNIHMAIDYDHSAIEIAFPRTDLALPNPLNTVCIAVVSYKPGIYADGTLVPGLDGGHELPQLHPFDPQAVQNGICPPLAGEEGPVAIGGQVLSNGPDHADIMAPAWVDGVNPYVDGWYVVMDQKFVDMSPLAKLDISDAATGQENITDYYSFNQQFWVNINITDAVNVTLYSMSITWDPTVLDCISWQWQFGTPMLPGAAGIDWSGAAGTIDHVNGRILPAGAYAWFYPYPGPSGSGTIVKARFNVTAPYGTSWIGWLKAEVAVEENITLATGMGKKFVEFPMKQAWFKKSAPAPGPPDVVYTQTPAAPPHYPNDTITFDLSSSVPGFNGTQYVPIVNYSLTVKNSTNDVLYAYEGPNPVISFTPMYPDTYTFILDVELDPNFDPAYSAAHPDWLVVEETVQKTVIEKAATGIDCYTEVYRHCGYETPFLGKGWNMSADAYTVDDNVTVFSYVFYNNWPRQSVLVSYEVYDANGTLVLVRNAFTNASGISNMSFRILTVCMNPDYAFGKWHIFQKVYMCEEAYNDTLWFDVGWLMELLTVTPGQSIYHVGDPVGDHMSFDITYKSIAQIPRDVVFSVVVYDDDGVPIAVTWIRTTVDPGRYCDPEFDSITIDCMVIPKWTYPGVATVYVNAWFNNLPTLCGHPCCPEISAIFLITAP